MSYFTLIYSYACDVIVQYITFQVFILHLLNTSNMISILTHLTVAQERSLEQNPLKGILFK